jgi:hypothetical protein
MNKVFSPVVRTVKYITLYGIVRAMAQNSDSEEILNICDGIVNANDWAVNRESQQTLLLISDVLNGVQKWIQQQPQRIMLQNTFDCAVKAYHIESFYVCDIQSEVDL